MIESEGGVADIEIFKDIRKLSGDIISKACFGSNYFKGGEIFSKLRDLQELVSDKILLSIIPGMRFELFQFFWHNDFCFFVDSNQNP